MSAPPANPGALPDPLCAIVGVERVTTIFGRWPTFHDAEICALHVAGEPEAAVVTVQLHVFAVSSAVDERGNHRLDRHTRITLRFDACTHLRLDSLDRHTSLFALRFAPLPGPEPAGARWAVEFESNTGPDGSLICRGIEVVGVEPWLPAGDPRP